MSKVAPNPTPLNLPEEYIEEYLRHIEDDYKRTYGEDARPFNVDYDVGFKYIRVFTEREGGQPSAHSFIVNVSTKHYDVGTILKSNSWSHPATNKPRGHLLTKDFSKIKWTGAT